jgi:hypothetical protein
MKKLLLFTIFALSFYDNLRAQFYNYAAWTYVPQTDLTATSTRFGNINIGKPLPWIPEDYVDGKGYLFYDSGNHWQWGGNPTYGLTVGKPLGSNFSVFDNNALWNTRSLVLSGYGGVGFRTQNGGMIVHQNGIVSIGLQADWRDQAEIRRLSKKGFETGVLNEVSDYLLYVKTGIVTEKMKVSLVANWPDYVFKKDYTLTPLSIVEQHIKEKGYLHKSKSATEVEKDGIEVAETAKAQQEKIEELFLHLIDMDKRLKAVEAENAQLKADLNNNKK